MARSTSPANRARGRHSCSGYRFRCRQITFNFGGADHRLSWSASFAKRWQTTPTDRLPTERPISKEVVRKTKWAADERPESVLSAFIGVHRRPNKECYNLSLHRDASPS